MGRLARTEETETGQEAQESRPARCRVQVQVVHVHAKDGGSRMVQETWGEVAVTMVDGFDTDDANRRGRGGPYVREIQDFEACPRDVLRCVSSDTAPRGTPETATGYHSRADASMLESQILKHGTIRVSRLRVTRQRIHASDLR